MINTSYTLEELNKFGQHGLAGLVGIEFIAIETDCLTAKMPVDKRTQQPFGLLHGGASAVLAETVGSVASWLCLEDPSKQVAVGVEINANHLKSARDGYVYAKCTPLRLGRNTHVWDIRISNEQGELVCVSRLTTMIINKK